MPVLTLQTMVPRPFCNSCVLLGVLMVSSSSSSSSANCLHINVQCLHACMFVSACMSILVGDYFVPFNLHTVYINTKLKEINRCGSVCLACLPGFVCTCHELVLDCPGSIDPAAAPGFAPQCWYIPDVPSAYLVLALIEAWRTSTSVGF